MKTSHCSEVRFIYIGFFPNQLFLKNIELFALPCSVKRSPRRDKNSFRMTRGLKPPSGEVKIFVQFCRVQPKEPDLWPHVLGSEGELEFTDITRFILRVKTP
jgi:hypothetical protein